MFFVYMINWTEATMRSYYWIKLYHEILHDPKMGRLSDRLWRRVIEMFLMAGECGEDGTLPSVEDMAWTLRVDQAGLQAELEAIAEYGILEMRDEQWFVTHFLERQEHMSVNERVSRHRNRVRKQQYYGTETKPETGVQQDCNNIVTTRYTDKSRVDKSRVEIDNTPAPEKPKTRKSPKEKQPMPAAVQIFYANTERYPVKALYQDIDTTVGHDPPELERWARVIKAWLGQGWNKGNVNGMLEFFRRNKIPGNGGNGHGKNGGNHGGVGWAKRDPAAGNSEFLEQIAAAQRAEDG